MFNFTKAGILLGPLSDPSINPSWMFRCACAFMLTQACMSREENQASWQITTCSEWVWRSQVIFRSMPGGQSELVSRKSVVVFTTSHCVFHYCSGYKYEVYFTDELTSWRKYSLSSVPVVRGVIVVNDSNNFPPEWRILFISDVC